MTRPRPRIFRVRTPDFGWITFTDGLTDIPSVLDAVWAMVQQHGWPYEILDARRVS